MEKLIRPDLNLLGYSVGLQEEHKSRTAAGARRARGQVFTPESICRFMASRVTQLPERVRILDAGAGVGSLAVAVCERLLTLRSARCAEFVLYESDPTLLPALEANMNRCRRALEAAGVAMTYQILGADFALDRRAGGAQRRLFEDDAEIPPFDLAIMNPPYFKIGADSRYAAVMRDSFRSCPNIYTLFMARAAELLRPDGELIAITPRSFCNGAYFRDFRRWFFARMSLLAVHSFDCRRSTFDDVLQESIITHTRRLGVAAPFTTVSASPGREFAMPPSELRLSPGQVLDDSAGDMLLRIPASAAEAAIIEAVEAWPGRFGQLGLRISTGPVVMFRVEQFLLTDSDDPQAVPLIAPHNVRPFRTVWPLNKRDKPLAFRVCPGSMKHLLPMRNYVLLRRFSAKEERRRLTASYYLQSEARGDYLALENHLNYIRHTSRELTVDEVCGLTALFNSALLDGYFRIISGNTQVNATEIRSIRFPSLDQVAAIGARVGRGNAPTPASVERVVLDELGINGHLSDHLMGVAS